MASLHVKKGDTVKVIAGKEKGKTGQISSVNVSASTVTIDGLNEVCHFVKPRNAQEKGGIIKRSAGIDSSNVMIVCPACGKTTRIAHAEVEGKKIRVCKKCGESLDVKVEAKKAVKKSATKKTTTKKTKTAEIAE